MKNYLFNTRYFGGGGLVPVEQFSQTNLHDPNSLALNKSFGQTINQVGSGISTAMPYFNAAKSAIDIGIDSYKKGESNFDKGKAKSALGTLQENEQLANNVLNSYSAGQTDLNTIRSFDSGVHSQSDLKTGKDWKNILGSTGSGAMIGASAGSMIPGIGNAVGVVAGSIIGAGIGAVSSAIGAISGKNKRIRETNRISNAQNSQDYAVDYHNWQQEHQLQSANDNAAQIQNNNIRKNVLNLVAFGGKLHRKNFLISGIIPF